MQKRIVPFFLSVLLPFFAQAQPAEQLAIPALQAFLMHSDLTYFEELHGDLLSNADVTMPVFAGCPMPVTKPEDAQCSQWASSKWILEHLNYPENGYKAGWVGEFRVEYTIDNEGKVKDITVVNCESATLAAALRKTIAGLPRWSPAVYAGNKVSMRYYTEAGFFMGKNIPQGATNSTAVLLTWGNAQATNNVLTLTEAELNTIKNEPITVYYGDDELLIEQGEMTLELPHLTQNKMQKMDAAETLDPSRTSKFSAFIDAYVTKGSSIRLEHLVAPSPSGGEMIQLPDFKIIIR